MKYKLLSYARYALQILSLSTFIFLFTYLVYPLDEPASVLELFSHFDPWMLLGQLRFEYVFSVWAWLPILIIVATLLLGRFFCGWLCPFGAFMMLADTLGNLIFKHTGLKKWAKFRQNIIIKLLPLRYLWLCLLLIPFILGFNFASSLTPFAIFSHEIVRLFLGTIPWILISIFIFTVLFGRVWCTIFCPTGILFSLLSKLRLFKYHTNGNCVHCNKCMNHCPVGAAPNEKGIAGDECLICGKCASVCPTKTISFRTNNSSSNEESTKSKTTNENNTSNKNGFTRRQFLKLAGVFIIGILISIWGKASRIYKKVLRPPGALPESEFKAVCNRCGRCLEVCPNNALKLMPLSDGIDAFETPYIIARQANCSLCLACQEVCPTGAIAKVPVENVNMGKATIDTSRCLAWSQGKDCFICGEQCLRVAINIEGENKPVVQTDLCVGCGTCERNCPVDGIAAIQVTPR